MSETARSSAFIGLGSNLDNPVAQVAGALRELDGVAQTRCVGQSSLYQTQPIGPADQPDFINAVAELRTGLTPLELLAELQALELRHRRVRTGQRWGPRTLDLDLLLFADLQLDGERLILPHPRLAQRAFVLYPLAELAGEALWIPGFGRLGGLLPKVSGHGIRQLA